MEIGVHCEVLNLLVFPEIQSYDDEIEYNRSLNQYKLDEAELFVQRDALQMQREDEVTKYLTIYGGVQQGEWDNGTDSIYFKLSISGNGLRDLVITYQYLFKVSFPAVYQIEEQKSSVELNEEAEIIAPNDDAPIVCIIDSGIQQSHRLIAPSINPKESVSYVTGDSRVGDFVKQTGHGTKVAGAVLYPRTIPVNGIVKLQTRLQNARILNANNEISDEEFAPALMKKIVSEFANARIFNLSVTEKRPYTGSHMHELAESIDKLIHEKDILFVISAGNLYESTGSAVNPGINEFVQGGVKYPLFLDDDRCKIANPAVSSFALTVGSVSHTDYDNTDIKAVAGKDCVSPFSRTGFGLWGSIKPDVVEYGGDLVVNKMSSHIAPNTETSVELVNSTLFNAAAHGKEGYGTSYSAPKVSHLVAMLQLEHPKETTQMYRALVIQSARLPAHCFANPSTRDFARYGYGIPNLARALNNTVNRITFVQQGNLGAKKADMYKLIIPSDLRGEHTDFQLLVEVTLAFTAKTRARRKGAHSYLSTWLEWKSSHNSENFKSFRNRTIEYLENGEAEDDHIESGDKAIQWIIRENPNWSKTIKINRNNSSVQKSWAIIEPHQFTDDFSIAIM